MPLLRKPSTDRPLPARRDIPEGAPWWRFGMVWFALSGPALVVVAGFVTMAIAFGHADVVLTEAAAPGGSVAAGRAGSTAPALQARNHAATPAH
jgi:uncharacterized protein